MTDFAFRLSKENLSISLNNTQFLGGRFDVDLTANGDNWHSKITAKNIDKQWLVKLVKTNLMTKQPFANLLDLIKQGQLSLKAELDGHQHTLNSIQVTSEFGKLTGQTDNGKLAAENLGGNIHFSAKLAIIGWQWQSQINIAKGALYVDPIYLEPDQQPISWVGTGTANPAKQSIAFQDFAYLHPAVGKLTGNASLSYPGKLNIDKLDVAGVSLDLQKLNDTYINPFFGESLLKDLKVMGEATANFSFVQQQLTKAAVNFNHLKLHNQAGRIQLQNGNGTIRWSIDPTTTENSTVSWQQLMFNHLPFGQSKLDFTSQGNHIMLANKVNLPLFNGTIAIDQFSWQGKGQDEPEVAFSGSINRLSMEAASKAMGWMPLLGEISGQIPNVTYHDKTLKLGGEILLNVFDGLIKIKNLASSGLLGNYPKILSDIEFSNLDLQQITDKIEFGSITGKVSGYVNDLVLQNWQPTTFITWLETAEDDDTAHTISQKAVKNIANLGGGGAANALSGTFLSLFETFRYDKIGMGCYLYNGVCQMMGMEPSGQTYYLIKGGGVPRIDVVGYNQRVNWDVLVERLKRLSSPDNVVIE